MPSRRGLLERLLSFLCVFSDPAGQASLAQGGVREGWMAPGPVQPWHPSSPTQEFCCPPFQGPMWERGEGKS